ncbi:hypothetical protein IJG91_01995 [Candidatus Saccharibacteria bacterium]|nr:hypothetical protein [Candidatus Saccharibacteria bacterium]MBQ3352409.1 hypothetical protein [Candidatus Saccharibacteria bacterium]
MATKSTKTSLSLDPEQAAAQKKAEKVAYLLRKEQVIKREKTNDRLIIFFRSTGVFWNAVERSAIYYAKLLFPHIKKPGQKSNPIQPDRDYSQPSSTGIVHIPDINRLLERAEKAGYKVKREKNEDFVAIELRNKVTPEQYNILLNEDKEKRSIAARMVSTAIIWPGIKTETLNQLVLCRSMVRNLDHHLQRVIGDPMMENLIKIVRLVELAARGTFERAEAIVGILECVDNLDGYVLSAIALRIFDNEQVYQFSTGMMKLRRLVEAEVKKRTKSKEAE